MDIPPDEQAVILRGPIPRGSGSGAAAFLLERVARHRRGCDPSSAQVEQRPAERTPVAIASRSAHSVGARHPLSNPAPGMDRSSQGRMGTGMGLDSFAAGRGEAWYRVRFGAVRSPVRIRPPRLAGQALASCLQGNAFVAVV